MTDQSSSPEPLDLRTDCEILRDGTRRWLWRIIYQGRLYSAGVCPDLEQAHGKVCLLCGQLTDRLKSNRRDRSPSAPDATVVDLDALGTGTPGHTDDSDPAHLGGI